MDKQQLYTLMQEPLLSWYHKVHRELPWRGQKNAYYTWVSEIMLQQTRVEAVKPYFHRFIEELPTIEELAKCREEKLLKLWEGLGYYNRVRNMQKAAIYVVEEYNGVLPAAYDRLLALPGIGSYTAGAIASIAYDIPVPAVDGNVLRVLSRLTASHDDIMKQSVRRVFERDLGAVMPAVQPGNLNQALMELGAVVCIPNGMAKCRECPVSDICKAKAEGIQDSLPVRSGKKPRRIEERTVLVIQDGERVAIRKRPGRGLLAGMYELPNEPGYLSAEDILSWVREENLDAVHIEQLEDATHIFSHVEWRMIGYRIRVAALEELHQRDMIFVNKEEAGARYAIPSAFSAYTGLIKED